MINNIFIIFYYVLFFLFLTGTVIILFSTRRSEISILRKGLVSIFLIHTFLYILAGMLGIKFGWHRNFFYLLPVYFLVIFFCLKMLINNRVIFYVVSVVLLSVSLCSSIKNCFSWDEINLLREMVSLASQIEGESLIISARAIDLWPFHYYTKKYKISDKTLFLSVFENKKNFSEIIQKLGSKDKFVVIEPFSTDILIQKGRDGYAKLLEIVEKKDCLINVGPYIFLRKAIRWGPQRIFEYFYIKKQ